MNEQIREFSAALADAAQAAGASLVRVEAGHRFGSTGSAWSADTIVTASHAVRREDGIEVGLPDGSTAPARLAGRDEGTDVAVLKLDAPAALQPVAWAGLEQARVGQWVLALARPGKTVRAAAGVIGALGEGWRTPWGGRVERYLEPDVAVRPGFSGSLLVDAAAGGSSAGWALGMNTVLGRYGTPVTLPAETLRRVVPALLAQGRLPRGYLGIHAMAVRVAEEGPASDEPGLLIASVEKQSPAHAAGLQQGDILLTLDGQAVSSLGALRALLDENRAERSVPLRLLRAGQTREVQVQLGTR